MKDKVFWINTLLVHLFEAEKRRINKMIFDLTSKNSKIKNQFTSGFKYQGEMYIPSEYHHLRIAGKTLPSLSIQLSEEVITFSNEKIKLEKDMIQVKQLLVCIIANCNDEQELRDSLPECLVALSPLKVLPRKFNEPTYLTRSDEHHKREYYRLLPLIEMYSVTQLLY